MLTHVTHTSHVDAGLHACFQALHWQASHSPKLRMCAETLILPPGACCSLNPPQSPPGNHHVLNVRSPTSRAILKAVETLGGRVLKEDLGHWVITIPNFCHSLFRLCAFMWAATTLHFCCYRQLFYHAFAACVGLRFSGSKMKQSFFSSLDCFYRVLSLCIGKVKEIQIDKVSEWYSALNRLPFGTTSSPNTERVIFFSGGGGVFQWDIQSYRLHHFPVLGPKWQRKMWENVREIPRVSSFYHLGDRTSNKKQLEGGSALASSWRGQSPSWLEARHRIRKLLSPCSCGQ